MSAPANNNATNNNTLTNSPTNTPVGSSVNDNNNNNNNNNNSSGNAPDRNTPTPMSGVEPTGAAASIYADPLSEIHIDILSMKDKLKSLAVEKARLSTNRHKSAEVEQQVKELVAQQLALQQELKAAKETLTELTSDLPSVVSSSSGDSSTSKNTFTIDSRAVPVFSVIGINADHKAKADNVKVFSSVDAFLSRLSKIVEGKNGDINVDWHKALHLAMPHDQDHWYNEALGKHKDEYNWDQVCKIMRKRFVSRDSMVHKAIEVFRCRMRANETTQRYGNRFHNLVREAGLTNCDVLAMLYLLSLPTELHKQVLIAYSARPGNDDRLPKNLDEIIKLSDMVSVTKRNSSEVDDSSSVSSSSSSADSARPTKKAKKHHSKTAPHFCVHHNRPTFHTSEECRDKPASPNGPTCKRCKGPLSPGHKCGNNRKFGGQGKHTHATTNNNHSHNNMQVNHITDQGDGHVDESTSATHPGDEAIDAMDVDADNDADGDVISLGDLEALYGEDTANASAGKSLCTTQLHDNPYLLKTPLLIQNERLLGLVDTGAEISVINKAVCDKHKWLYTPVAGNILFAGKDSSVERIGLTAPLKLRYNQRTFTHRFEVMDLDQHDVILGYDLLPKLGISLLGVSTQWDDQIDSQAADPSVHDAYKRLTPNDSPAANATQQCIFHDTIKPFLKANANIPKTSFCNVDESVIDLSSVGSNTSHHRQYPLPFEARPIIDAQIQKWLDDGAIVPAPVNTQWNSPLTLADKKDANGNKIGKRLCLDPRHINKFLEDDRYPLPTINEIFHALGGSTVFTTLDLTNAFHRFKIRPHDRPITTFTYNNRQYMFRGCPFGLKPISSKFQRVMHIIFKDMPFVRTIVDDIVVFSPDMETHTKHVQQAISALTRANLILNPAKCHFAQKAVYLLGFCISEQGKSLDTRKVSNAIEWPLPRTGKDIQRFMGAHLKAYGLMSIPRPLNGSNEN
ncbi:hypothetical protein RO3G_16746 [Lichtheimia corymbifera JMRC:FSU:9682]|uniref:Peptidase A2 domain-containing protein n=1 Tax=Lichtheimia corymbifera JMRC:FSU:9682 TaxID=1263082 RepID=A0A068SFQ3_9FUNG|nr:hypothetical protein RO3G_16746 [Lichtheimia corymbifera JMRC:FSU:9682]